MKSGDEKAFASLFHLYYSDLVIYAYSILGPGKEQLEESRDIVQTLFVQLWERKESLEITISIKSYLMRCVRNACLDNIRHQSIAMEYHERILNINKSSELDAEHYIFYSDLSKQLEAALNNLPEKYRTIFELNRLKGIKQKDIANNLNISVRTVEDRLSKALKALSIQLQDFRILFFL